MSASGPPIGPDESNEAPSAPSAPFLPAPVAWPRRRPFRPLATLALLLVTLAMAGAQLLYGGFDNPLTGVYLGEKVNTLISEGEYWRLVTANFLHGGWWHLGSNMVGLLLLGIAVEYFFGPLRTLGIYILSGVAGFALSYQFTPEPSLGASASIFGLMGALIIAVFKCRQALGGRFWRLSLALMLMLGIEVIAGMTSNRIDQMGHLGGLLGGATLGLLAAARVPGMPRLSRDWLPMPALVLLAVVAVSYGWYGAYSSAGTRSKLGEAARQYNQAPWRQKLKLIESALDQDPDLDEVRYEYARLLRRYGRPGESLTQMARILKRRPHSLAERNRVSGMLAAMATIDMQQGRYEAAERWYREALPLADQPRARALIQNNLAYLLVDNLQRDYDEAEQLSKESLSAEPDNGIYLDTLAWIYYRQGRHDEALELQQRVVDQRRAITGEEYYHLGVLYRAKGKRREAITAFRRALRSGRPFAAAQAELDQLTREPAPPPHAAEQQGLL